MSRHKDEQQFYFKLGQVIGERMFFELRRTDEEYLKRKEIFQMAAKKKAKTVKKSVKKSVK